MAVRVAINGFGRIGRNILRAIYESGRKDIEVVAINDLGPPETNAHLLRFDSVHGRFPHEVKVVGDSISIGGALIKVTAIKDPSQLPYKELGVDIAMECTGIFTARDKAALLLAAGAKRVLVSAPSDGADNTIVYGVNHGTLKAEHHVVSNGSCTTNCLAPVAKVLNELVGISHGYMTTIHAYTGDQPTLDADEIVQNLRHWGQAVRGARAVRDDVVLFLERPVVDAIDDRVVGPVGWGRNQHALGSGGEQGRGLVARREDAGAFHRDVDAELLIGKLRGIFDRGDLDFVRTDRNRVARHRHGVGKTAVDAVKAQEMGVGLNRAQVVERDHFHVGAARLVDGAQNVAPDAPEAIDCDTNRHTFLLKPEAPFESALNPHFRAGLFTKTGQKSTGARHAASAACA